MVTVGSIKLIFIVQETSLTWCELSDTVYCPTRSIYQNGSEYVVLKWYSVCLGFNKWLFEVAVISFEVISIISSCLWNTFFIVIHSAATQWISFFFRPYSLNLRDECAWNSVETIFFFFTEMLWLAHLIPIIISLSMFIVSCFSCWSLANFPYQMLGLLLPKLQASEKSIN